MDKRLSQLKEAQERFDRNNEILIPRIQRVPMFLRQNERFYKYCTPKIISFGPIHHNAKNLKEGEHYKLLWTSIFVADYGKKIDKDANEACMLLLKKIEDNIEDLKNMFTEDAIEGYNDNDLAWILFVDGCSLLHFMENVDDQCPDALNLKFDQLMHIWRDTFLLENQLPKIMLEILCEETSVDLDFLINNSFAMGACKRLGMAMLQLENHKPFHLLDFGRSVYVPNFEEHAQMEKQYEESEHNPKNTKQDQKDSDKPEIDFNWNTYKSIRDLKTVGIQVVANKTDKWTWSNISFKSKWFSGELRLPIFLFNDVTPYVFRNLIAYEMCPDVHYNYECCSFFSFMDSLIDNAEDVKELRSAGVFQNLLGSDEELAKLFNDLGDDLPTKMYCHFDYTKAVAYSKKYIFIKHEIEKHYKNKWKTWLAQAYNTHFNTPWAMIAFLAAVLALVLTFIQTWFTMNPK
ncbi:hypothetical protein MtrunA17_Chr8g0354591 [Medicago truncatula]|uniref:DUF247 domain protein n=1 Tax=Medicago truncatula TaxID=3880 RepID=G7LJ67_MEDTR|nr:putative UPF0481 protein At3g02645 [Medicago truncatula]AET02553.1 DUF247 domain protein [Medicago truncatula]RHN40425.1 hypothetical protein MtrunA17_Chr8g0354591 [Medicago truncatula]